MATDIDLDPPSSQLDADEQPYIGPRPFERKDEFRFFGRNREANELVSLIIAHSAVLLYAQSGAGKTSLINAKLIPKLRNEEHCEVLVARVQGYPADIDLEQIGNIYMWNAIMCWAPKDADPAKLAALRLGQFLGKRELADPDEMPRPRIVVFDQFEELFTFYPRHWAQRRDFFQQVREALDLDPTLRVLFSMREDHIAELDPYVAILPEKLRTRFRLERLREKQATASVVGPLEHTGRSFAPGVAESLVADLLAVQSDDGEDTGGVRDEFIEPVQLQVVCQTLWRSLGPNDTEITAEHLEESGNVNTALSQFYERSVRRVVRQTGVSEETLRRWFDEKLITPTGTRGMVFVGEHDAGGLPLNAVEMLDRLYLIRREPRGRSSWYELTHDRLIIPIQRSNRIWSQDAARVAAREAKERIKRLKQVWSLFAVIALCFWVTLITWKWIEAANERDIAREQRREADAQRELAVQRENGERIATKAAQAELRKFTVDRGFRTLESGDVAGSLLWFVEVLGQDIKNQVPERVDRIRIGAGFAQMPALSQLWFDPELLTTSVSFSRDGRIVIARSGISGQPGEARVYDATSGELLTPNYAHNSAVASAVFSPDGRYLLTASGKRGGDNGEVAIWDTQSQSAEPAARLSRPGAAIHAGFDSQGERVVVASERSGGAEGNVCVWSWKASPAEIAEVTDTFGMVNHASFDPTGELLAIASSDGKSGQVWIWDVAASCPATPRLEHRLPATFAAFGPDGKLIATASGEQGTGAGEARVWDAKTGAPITAALPHADGVISITFSPDGNHVVTTSHDATAKLWNAQSGRLLQNFEHTSSVIRADFSPDGRYIATASRDGTARIWEVASGRPTTPPLNHHGTVSHATFSPDAQSLLTASRHAAQIWQVHGANPLPMVFQTTNVKHVALSADSERLLTISSGKSEDIVQVWESSTGIETAWIEVNEGANAAALNTDGTLVVLAHVTETPGNGYGIVIWQLEDDTGRTVAHERGRFYETSAVRLVSISPDNRWMLTIVDEKTSSRVRVWDLQSDGASNELPATNPVTYAAFDPHSRRVVTASGSIKSKSGVAQVWDAATGEPVTATLEHTGGVIFASFSPAGDLVVTASADDTARVWRVPGGEPLTEPLGHTADVTHASFGPGGTRVLTVSLGQKTAVWDARANGRNIATFEHGSHAALSSDERLVVTVGRDGTARVWDVDTKELVAILEHRGDVQIAWFGPQNDQVFTISYAQAGGALSSQLAGRRLVEARVWNLAHSERSVDQLRKHAELLSARTRADTVSGTAPLKLDDIRNHWADLEESGVPIAKPSLDNHERAAGECEATEQWIAAAWHLGRMIEMSGEQLSDMDRAALLRRRALAQTNAQRWHEATADYTQAIQLASDNPIYLQERAGAYAELSKWEEAITDYLAAIKLDPANSLLWHDLNRAYDKSARWSAAVRDYSAAIESDPDNWRLFDSRALAHFHLSQWDRSLEDYTRAIELDPQNSRLWDGRGRVHANLQQWTKAIADYTEAIELAPSDGWLYRLRGTARMELGNWDEADEDLRRAIELDRDDPDAWTARAVVQLVLHRPDDYRHICQEMIGVFSQTTHGETANNVAWACLMAPGAPGLDQIVGLAERAVTNDSRSYYYLNTLGAALYRSGQFEAAAQRLREAMKAHTGQFDESPLQSPKQSRASLAEPQGTAWDWLFMAMTQHELEHPLEAREWLDKATRWIDERTVNGSAALSALHRQELIMLRDEAENKLGPP